MTKLCMVTYTRGNEMFTPALVELGNALRDILADFRCIVFVEAPLQLPDTVRFPVELKEQQGTKYRKLNTLLETDNAQYFLSVDNDIQANLPDLITLATDTICGEYDISWGRVFSEPKPSLISRLVDIDKLLSHRLLRPWLWNRKIGITAPGQCFLIKGESYRGKLIRQDTYLDDLALGLYTAQQPELKVLQSKVVVAIETPNETFSGLYLQRSRWAKGYGQILRSPELSTSDKRLLYLHGAAYHGLWIPNLLVLLSCANVGVLVALAYLFMTSVLITGKSVNKVPAAILYQVIFPVFHIRWMIVLFQELK